MAKRRYTETTIKILFGRSGNQCAAPDCTNAIVAAGSTCSDDAVVGQICHIYAASDNGPRGNPKLTDEERNAVDNLILLCGHHHPIVDKQHADYPADTLKAWKKIHEEKFQPNTAENIKLQKALQRNAFMQGSSDERIHDELNRIRAARFLTSFPTKQEALRLATAVDEGEYSGGSNSIRAKALAWCARFLAIGDTVMLAQQLIEKSKRLETNEEAQIAEAFILSNTDKSAALLKLAEQQSEMRRSAALRIVINHDGFERSFKWLEQAGLQLADLDSEGKFISLLAALEEHQWDRAFDIASKIPEDDAKILPALHYPLAMANLLQAVPTEFRPFILRSLPVQVKDFPLSSTDTGLKACRLAGKHFHEAAKFGKSVEAVDAYNLNSDFALWLKLRDPQQREQALSELTENMRGSNPVLRHINFALQYGIRLDIPTVEKRINQQIALKGKGTTDEASALFFLAMAKESAKAVAEHIAEHKSLFYELLHKPTIQAMEVEALARSGMISAAEDLLNQARKDLDADQISMLERIIAVEKGADPAAERKKQFEETNSIGSLTNLFDFLAEREAWPEAVPYAEDLFQRTRSIEDGIRLARALNGVGQFTKLLNFLASYQTLVTQSNVLRTLWAWSLYREGRFDDALTVLQSLISQRDEANDRALRVNIAIASGNWNDLIEYTNGEWLNRDKRSGAELLVAGQLAQTVNAPRGRDLIKAATEKSPDDPNILAAAYFHASRAGWEDETTAQWLNTAASLSGDNGPLQSVSMKELLEKKPSWDQRQASVLEQLTRGSMPMFGAAYILNRSLVDFTLLQGLANPDELDVRRRSLIYSYSGARVSSSSPAINRIALDLTALLTFASLGILEVVLRSYVEIVIPHSTLGWLFREYQNAAFHQPSRIKDAHRIKRLIATGALKVLNEPTSVDPSLEKEVGAELSSLLTTAKARSKITSTSHFVVRSAPIHRAGSLTNEKADVLKYQPFICGCTAIVSKLHSKGLLMAEEYEHAISYLKLHEQPWTSEPEIDDTAELYLDDLSVSYLGTVGVLDKLSAGGFTAYITNRESVDADRLIAFEDLSERQIGIMESIRDSLAKAIRDRQVRTVRSKQPFNDEEGEELIKSHPTFKMFTIQQHVDGFVVDDRFVNRHLRMDIKDSNTPIYTSLDILDDLSRKGIVTHKQLFAYRTKLRRMGHQMIPLMVEEISEHVNSARVKDGRIVETAELRSIRESILRLRMSNLLQMPLELPWLLRSMDAIAQGIRSVWCTRANQDEAIAIAKWLIDLSDLRGFAPSSPTKGSLPFASQMRAIQVFKMMTCMNTATGDHRRTYFEWIDRYLIAAVKQSEPEVFSWVTAKAQELISNVLAEA